jgi:hypothetical protein
MITLEEWKNETIEQIEAIVEEIQDHKKDFFPHRMVTIFEITSLSEHIIFELHEDGILTKDGSGELYNYPLNFYQLGADDLDMLHAILGDICATIQK